MSDLIERSEVLKQLRLNHKDVVYIDKNECARRIEAIPSARPKEGKWIKNVDGDYECSECHVAIRGEDKPIYPFCAWCGADMRKDEPQTDIHGLTDCDFCKEKNCEDCEGGKDEPQTDTEIAKAIVHKMIDDAVIAEDAYPDLRQKMHDAVDEYEPQTEREGER